ncbi:MAG TPA: DUF3306 domain-containing protein [Pseudolabrys sp.]
MNDRENFISRWSRRKREAADEKAQGEQPGIADAAKETDRSASLNSEESKLANADAAEFDPASLPPIESIEAGTDISAFLRDGVPSELRHAALRRAWSADASIRDFVGLNENYWSDVTGPAGVAGFGDLDPGVDVKRMVSELFGESPSKKAEHDSSNASAASAAVPRPTSEPKPASVPDQNTTEGDRSDATKIAASQNNPADDPVEQRATRRHGSALPE